MMKKLLLLLFMVPVLANAQYKFYYNDRFEISLKYPSTFKPGIAPTNNDGRTFLSSDKQCKIGCAGHYYISKNINEELKEYSQNISISYKTVKPNFFAFSGYTSDGNIYYQKSILRKLSNENAYVLKSVWITYPQAQKKKYDGVCKIVGASLK